MIFFLFYEMSLRSHKNHSGPDYSNEHCSTKDESFKNHQKTEECIYETKVQLMSRLQPNDKCRLQQVKFYHPSWGSWNVLNTSSQSNTEVKQHWFRIVLGWETTWELQELLAWVWITDGTYRRVDCVNLAPPTSSCIALKSIYSSQVECIQKIQQTQGE